MNSSTLSKNWTPMTNTYIPKKLILNIQYHDWLFVSISTTSKRVYDSWWARWWCFFLKKKPSNKGESSTFLRVYSQNPMGVDQISSSLIHKKERDVCWGLTCSIRMTFAYKDFLKQAFIRCDFKWYIQNDLFYTTGAHLFTAMLKLVADQILPSKMVYFGVTRSWRCWGNILAISSWPTIATPLHKFYLETPGPFHHVVIFCLCHVMIGNS